MKYARHLMMKLKLAFGIIAVLLAIISSFLMVVDGVAIILTYISLIFALFSMSVSNTKMLKIYAVIFVMSHIVLAWRISSDVNQNDSGQYSGFSRHQTI